jgi:IS6 family transposase
MKRRRTLSVIHPSTSAFSGFRAPPEIIFLAVRRSYLRSTLTYRVMEELLAERGIEVDHITLCR